MSFIVEKQDKLGLISLDGITSIHNQDTSAFKNGRQRSLSVDIRRGCAANSDRLGVPFPGTKS